MTVAMTIMMTTVRYQNNPTTHDAGRLTLQTADVAPVHYASHARH